METYAAQGRQYDEIWLLVACSPLIEAADLINASALFSERGGDLPVMAVAEYPAPVEWAFRRSDDGRLHPLQPAMHAIRSQDIASAYFDTGSFCIYPRRKVLESVGAGDYSSYVGYLLPRQKAIDIDTNEDWKLAEVVYEATRLDAR